MNTLHKADAFSLKVEESNLTFAMSQDIVSRVAPAARSLRFACDVEPARAARGGSAAAPSTDRGGSGE